MSHDEQHDDVSLDLDSQDGTVDDSLTDDGERSDDSDEVAANLDLDSNKNSDDKKDDSKKAAIADQHARAWASKIVAGKATYESIPQNHQYLIPRVRELLGQKEPEKKKEPEAEKSKKANMTQEQAVEYELLKRDLRSLSLTKEQVTTFNAKRKFYMSKGFNPLEALNEAVISARIDMETPQDHPKVRMGGSAASQKKVWTGTEDPSKMSRKELAEYKAYCEEQARG